jgi:hypothetical protein
MRRSILKRLWLVVMLWSAAASAAFAQGGPCEQLADLAVKAYQLAAENTALKTQIGDLTRKCGDACAPPKPAEQQRHLSR